MTRMGSSSQGDNASSRRLSKTGRSGKGGALYSDYYEDEPDEQPPQRSISLSALHPGPAPTLEPRMAQLETLEAKMASIEVSLSTTPRRKKPTSAATTPTPTAVPPPTAPATPGAAPAPGHGPQRDVAAELELLRTTLRDKENVIHSLKGQLCSTLSLGRLGLGGGGGGGSLLLQRPSAPPLNDRERRAARDRLARLRTDLDAKRLAIKNIKMALERLDITDGNIDVRIQQAELEYQLGREELNLLTVLEESRGLQAALDDAAAAANRESATVYNYVKSGAAVTLHAVQLVYDPKSPRFGAAPRPDGSGTYVEWAAEDSGLQKGDRLLEVNGKLLSAGSGARLREELQRLLSVSPAPAQLVAMRRAAPPSLDRLAAALGAARDRAGEAERARDSARTDNLRLTHRISYLEEQVADLMERVREEGRPLSSAASSASSIISTQAPPPSSPKPPEVQVFQKGPQVTALVANLPGLEVGNSSPSESRQKLPTVRAAPKTAEERRAEAREKASSSDTEKMHRSKKKSHLHSARSTNSLDIEPSRQKYVNSETSSERKSHQAQMEQRQRHLREARTSLYDLDKDRLNGKLDLLPDVGYARPNSCQPSSKMDTASQQSLDYSSESSSRYYKKHSDPRIARPVPPKKPLRLSLHRATSLQTVEANEKKSMKRNHRGESPRCGVAPWPSAIGSYRSQTSLSEKWC